MRSGLHYLLVVAYESVFRLVFSLPRFRVCNALKSLLLRAMGATVGRRVIFYQDTWIMPGRHLVLGDDVDLAIGVIITTSGGVTIGDRCLIGYRVQIISANHAIPSRPGRIFEAGHVQSPVCIANDCWIGANAVILPGVTIGEGSVVAAGSIVTKDVPAFSIVGGVPARVLSQRGSQASAP